MLRHVLRTHSASTGSVSFRLAPVVLAALLVATAAAGELGLGVSPARPAKQDTCPVCGMRVAPYPEWLAQVHLSDGSVVFFDGPKDLFRYLLAAEDDDLVERRSAATAIFVTSYYDGVDLDARQAVFVVGSDVLGPMGRELVPVDSREAAEELLRDHGGERILRFDEITLEVLEDTG